MSPTFPMLCALAKSGTRIMTWEVAGVSQTRRDMQDVDTLSVPERSHAMDVSFDPLSCLYK